MSNSYVAIAELQPYFSVPIIADTGFNRLWSTHFSEFLPELPGLPLLIHVEAKKIASRISIAISKFVMRNAKSNYGKNPKEIWKTRKFEMNTGSLLMVHISENLPKLAGCLLEFIIEFFLGVSL